MNPITFVWKLAIYLLIACLWGLFIWGFFGWNVSYQQVGDVPTTLVQSVYVFSEPLEIPSISADDTYMKVDLYATWDSPTVSLGIATELEVEKCPVGNQCTFSDLDFVAYGNNESLTWRFVSGSYNFVAGGYDEQGFINIDYNLDIVFAWPSLLIMGIACCIFTPILLWCSKCGSK
tara:strand:+ start:159 stop:686 length:528 start_codon:yes stop_codon:yes gene_type:complete